MKYTTCISSILSDIPKSNTNTRIPHFIKTLKFNETHVACLQRIAAKFVFNLTKIFKVLKTSKDLRESYKTYYYKRKYISDLLKPYTRSNSTIYKFTLKTFLILMHITKTQSFSKTKQNINHYTNSVTFL